MAKEKSKATAHAEKHSRQTVIDKRNRAAKNKVTKPGRSRDYHRRVEGPRVDLPARLQLGKPTFKSYFEFQENKDKQDKRLDTSVTRDKNPPPGFSFVPVGNPELTKKCKDISREREHMIFIVSDSNEEFQSLGHHVHRIGYHFRSADVEDACTLLGGVEGAMGGQTFLVKDNDKVPETQSEINKQADDALRDLFPRIPNHDREQIIAQSFQKGNIGRSRTGAPVVGLAEELPLARRVQLAANAHIRHVHTRYDELLQETDWFNARRLVEPVCLQIIMKWRGDEETGRDQLDEILREVVIIPDSDDEGEEEKEMEIESASGSDDDVQILREVTRAPSHQAPSRFPVLQDHMPIVHRPPGASKKPHLDDPDYEEKRKELRQQNKHQTRQQRRQKQQRPDRQERRGFARWERYEEARKRNRPHHTGSANLNYDDNANNMRQEPPFNPPYQMDRQPLQEARYGQPHNNSNYQPQFAGQEVHSPISLVNGLLEDNRLPVTYQDMFTTQGPSPFQPQFQRPASSSQSRQTQHQRKVSSHQGLPILTHEEHLRRQQQRRQETRIQQRPTSPEVIPSIESIDLTDSPVPVPRNSPRLVNGPPHRVQTAPQPQFVSEYDHWEPEPQQLQPLAERSGMVFVRDHDGKRRRVLEEPRPRHTEPEYVLVHRPRQDAHTFPGSRAPVPASQPDVRWLNDAYDPRQPILVSSSPYLENVPTTAPPSRVVSLRGGESRPSMFEDIFHDADENQARAVRGESKRPRPISNGHAFEQREQEPAMRLVIAHTPIFGVPSVPARASTMHYPLQESRRPEATPFMQPLESQPRPVERLPVYNQRGELVHLPDDELQRAIREADSRGPVYVRGSTNASRQQELQEIQQPHVGQREHIDDGHPGSQYVAEARPRHDYRSLRRAPPIRTQSDIEGLQPGYRERTVQPPPLRDFPYEQLPIRQAPRAPVEVIGPDGQRYMQLPGVNGQPGEILPIRTEREASMMPQSRPHSRPQSRMLREGTRGPFGQPDYSGQQEYEYDGQQGGKRVYGRNEVIVLDD